MTATGTHTPDMLWEDGSSRSWNALGVTGQPAWMLLDQYGQVLIDSKFGAPDEDDILEAIGA